MVALLAYCTSDGQLKHLFLLDLHSSDLAILDARVRVVAVEPKPLLSVRQ